MGKQIMNQTFIQPGKYNPLYTFVWNTETVSVGASSNETAGFDFTPQVWYRIRSIHLQTAKTAAAGPITQNFFSTVELTFSSNTPSTMPDGAGAGIGAIGNTLQFIFGPSSPKMVSSLLVQPGYLINVALTGYNSFVLNDNCTFCFVMEWTRENFKV